MVSVGELIALGRIPVLIVERGEARSGTLADVVRGPTVLTLFTGTGGGACRRQIASVVAASDEVDDLAYGIVAASKSSPASHARLSERLGVDFPMISDPDSVIARAFGCLRTTVRRGTPRESPSRSAFVLDVSGRILGVIPEVDPGRHGAQIVEALRALDAAHEDA